MKTYTHEELLAAITAARELTLEEAARTCEDTAKQLINDQAEGICKMAAQRIRYLSDNHV